MHHWAYAILDLGAALSALGLALWLRVTWLQHLRQAAGAIAGVGLVFLGWDSLVTQLGHWTFNPFYIWGWYLGNLPVEEVAFFVAIPLVSLTIWGWSDRLTARAPADWAAALLLPVVAALVLATTFTARGYSLAAAGAAVTVSGWVWRRRAWLNGRAWLVFQVAMLTIFFIANTVLTALPVVEYNPAAFSGWRIGTVPAEDFLYNFALTNAVVLAYLELAYRARAAARAKAWSTIGSG